MSLCPVCRVANFQLFHFWMRGPQGRRPRPEGPKEAGSLGRGCSPPHQLGDLGEHCKLPLGSGEAPATWRFGTFQGLSITVQQNFKKFLGKRALPSWTLITAGQFLNCPGKSWTVGTRLADCWNHLEHAYQTISPPKYRPTSNGVVPG